MIANFVQSGHVILETTTSSSSSSSLSSSPFSSLFMFVLFYPLKTATMFNISVLLQIAYFNFNYFFVFNYTNCTLKYVRFNDSVRSDAALRIIAQEIHTSLFHIYPLMPTTDTGFLPYRHIVIESTVLGCA